MSWCVHRSDRDEASGPRKRERTLPSTLVLGANSPRQCENFGDLSTRERIRKKSWNKNILTLRLFNYSELESGPVHLQGGLRCCY